MIKSESAFKKRISLFICCCLLAGSVFCGEKSLTVDVKGETAIHTIQIDLGGDFPNNTQSVRALVTNTALNEVKPEIFGANISWIGDGYGLWNDRQKGVNSTLLEQLKNSGVTKLRYPGGIEGDYFHWAETVGNARTPQINPFSTGYPTYTAEKGTLQDVNFGPDEFFSLCRQAGVQANIQLNTGNGTVDEAIAYLQYMKDAGYYDRLSSVGIGNEACMAAETVDGMHVTKTPEEYISFCRSLFQKMSSDLNDGSFQIGAIGITPGHPLCANPDWDQKILSALKNDIDFIDVHIGYSYYLQGNATAEQGVKCYLASAKWVSDLIQTEKELIARYGGDRADQIGIQISELGPVGGDIPNSLAGALYLADLYDVILAESKITATDYLPLMNHYASAQILGSRMYTETGMANYHWKNAVSYVFKMYAEQIGRQVLKTNVFCTETFNSDACGLVPAVSDVPVGTVHTYYDPETATGTVFVLNKSLNENLNYDIRLPFDISVDRVTEFHSDDPTVSNKYNHQAAVYPVSRTQYGGTGRQINLCAKPISLIRIDFTATEKPTDSWQWQDDFSTNTIDSYQIAGPDNGAWGSWSVQDGKLQVVGNPASAWWGTACMLKDAVFDDFIMEFNADVSAGYGIILRAQDDAQTAGTGLNTWYGGNGYAFLHWEPVEASARVQIYDYNGNNTLLANAGTLSPMKRAHWLIRAVGDQITVSVTDRDHPDNTLTYTLNDERYRAGSIAFYNLTAAGVTSFKVDDLSIHPCGENATVISENFLQENKQYIAYGNWQQTSSKQLCATVRNDCAYYYLDRYEWRDTVLEFDVPYADEGAEYGVVLHSPSPDGVLDGNGITVMYDGNWIFAGKLNNGFTQLTDTEHPYAYCPSENGVVPYHWKITCTDGTVRVYLNRNVTPILTVTDHDFSVGTFGFRVRTTANTKKRICFKDLRICGERLGDLNGDNDVDVRDLVRLKKFGANNSVKMNRNNADFFGNGEISAQTAVLLRQYLLGTVSKLFA